LPPRHNSEPYNNILTKEDVVKRIPEKNTKNNTFTERKDNDMENREGENKKGFVQGVCECANVAKEKDLGLGKNILSKFGVTKAIAKKYAEPETYKETQKDLLAPKPKIEQKIEQTRTQSKGRSM
jgi:hypothetical protein